MFCQMCGTRNPDNAIFCLACGARLARASAPGARPPITAAPGAPQSGMPPSPGAPVAAPVAAGPTYAGFWLRTAAFLIDNLLLSIPAVLLMIPLFGWMAWVLRDAQAGRELPPEEILPVVIAVTVVSLLYAVGTWLYFAYMESSPSQATFGKRILGLVVTDLNGRRIGFGRATGRYFAKIFSSMVLYIGFIMVGFTERRQGLHDILASTLVLRRPPA
jgi:uncharacterized RDD family membrane protein YckC